MSTPFQRISDADVDGAVSALSVPATNTPIFVLLHSAKRSAEAASYVADLDHVRFGGLWVCDSYYYDVVGEAHCRWAAASAITALDQLAAALGHVHTCKRQNGRELSLNDLAPGNRAQHHSALAPKWQRWVSAAQGDHRYETVKNVRNALVHAGLPSDVVGSSLPFSGHDMRGGFRVVPVGASGTVVAAATPVAPRELINMACDVALEHTRAFLKTAVTP